MIVLDSSFVLSRLLNDRRAPYVRSVMASAPGDYAAPVLLTYEVANVLSRGHRRGELTLAEREAALAAFDAQLIEYDPRPVLTTLRAILDQSVREGLSAYDCTFLELALRRGAALATLDERLARAGVQAGLTVHYTA